MIKYVQQSINTIQQGKVSFSTNGPGKTVYPQAKEKSVGLSDGSVVKKKKKKNPPNNVGDMV